ncbi:DUF1254 domain-containing protein [Synechococcus sp. MU1625]|nr:DUF1254 domain-containing protein [Synechococcus sp. MU1625]
MVFSVLLSSTVKTTSSIFASLLVSVAGLASAPGSALAESTCPQPAVVLASNEVVPVTKANYAEAETQTVFAKYIADVAAATCTGGLGTILNLQKAADPKDRTVIRINFDTLYSWLILDLITPATFTLPQTNGRYQSAMVVNGQGYVYVEKDPGDYTLTEKEVGTRYALVAFRTGVNIQDPEDVAQAQALQAKLSVSQAETGDYIQPNQWDLEQMMALRAAYNEERNEKGVKSEDLFGRKGEVTPDQNNMGVAVGIGGLPKEGAVYLFYTPSSSEPQTLTLKDVPNGVNAFWSLTVYDKDGFPSGSSFNLNSAFAKPNAAGDVVINLGGDSNQDNHLEIYPGWNATLRIYNPKPAYFDGSWIRPELEFK